MIGLACRDDCGVRRSFFDSGIIVLRAFDCPSLVCGQFGENWQCTSYYYSVIPLHSHHTLYTMTVQYDKPRIVRVVTDMVVETPPGCTKDGYCKALDTAWTTSGTVNDQASTSKYECLDAANSRIFNGIDLTPETAVGLTELFPGEPALPAPICYHAQARDYDCAFYLGQMSCFTDASGILQCPVNEGGVPSTCDAMEADPTCSFMGSECTLADTITGNCHNFTDTYDCGFDQEIPGTGTSTTTYVCPGEIRCIGTECFAPPQDDANPDFIKASARLSSTQMVQMDTQCLDIGVCEIFKGDPYDCKKAIGGIQNCCNKPAGVSLVQYITTMYAAWDTVKATETVQSLQAAGTAVAGSIKDVGNNIMSTMPDVKTALTSAYDSIMGPGAELGSGATATSLTQPLYQAAGELLNTISPGLGEQVFAYNADLSQFTGGLSSTGMGAMINTVMIAYMYIQIAILIIQLIWACEKKEYELAAKREMRSCHYVGTYCDDSFLGLCLSHKESHCCFSSPLARIVQEQGRPQIGKGWGSPEAPNCSGYSMDQVAALDFGAMDLSEWIAILSIAGKVPQSLQAADANFTIEKLTTMQNPVSGTVQPVSTPQLISDALPDPTAGESTRARVRQDAGFQ